MKKVFACILSFIIAFTALLSLQRGQDVNAAITGVFEASGTCVEYYYSDSLFAQDSSSYSTPLADISLIASVATESRETAKSFYGELGFSNIEFNDGYDNTTDSDKIGVMVASKKININGTEKDLVVMGVRGINYGIEWADNFNVGKTGNHQGFDNNSKRAFEFIKNYINNHSIDKENVKIWIQGYSRAGAISYMSARSIVEEKLVKSQNDLYVYTFNAPSGVVDEWECTCIFNLVNCMDVVNRTAPSKWGFKKYGKIVYLGDPAKVMSLKNPNINSTEPLYYEDFTVRNLDLQSALGQGGIFGGEADQQYNVIKFYSNFYDFMSNDSLSDSVNTSREKHGLEPIPAISDRETYVDYYQEAFMYFFELTYSGAIDAESSAMGAFSTILGADTMSTFLAECFEEDQMYPDTIASIKSSIVIDSSSSFQLDETKLLPLLRLIGKAFRTDSGASSMIGLAFAKCEMMATLFGNVAYIASAHFPDVVLAWIRYDDSDPYYETNVEFKSELKGDLPTINGESVMKKNFLSVVNCEYDEEKWIFNGWYDENGTLLSSDPYYSFTVTKDVCVYADFEEAPEPTVIENEEIAETKETEITEKIKSDKKKSSSSNDFVIPVIIGIAGFCSLVAGIAAVVVVMNLKKNKKKDQS